MTRLIIVLAVGLLLFPLCAQAQPKTPPKNQAIVLMRAKGLTPTSQKNYWIYKKAICVKMGFAGKDEFVPPGKYDIRVGFPSGYILQEAEVKAGEKYVIPTGLFTFKEVTPPALRSTVPQELYCGETYLATGYQGTTARLLPGKYTVSYQDMNAGKPSEAFTSWQVIGPFPAPNPMKGFNTEYSPEKEKRVDPNRAYPDPGGAMRKWQKLEGSPDINLIEAFGDQWIVAYAATSLESDADKDVQLIIAHRSAIKVWLNGELVRSVPLGPNAYAPTRQVIFAKLRKGKNDLFIKNLRAAYDWPLSAVAVYCKMYEVNIEPDKE
jgi:hypothetical protein